MLCGLGIIRRFDLTASVKTSRGASHQLNVLVVAFLSFELSDDVLNVLKAVRLNKL